MWCTSVSVPTSALAAAAARPLLDGHRGGNAEDGVDVGATRRLNELPGVGIERLEVAALTFGERIVGPLVAIAVIFGMRYSMGGASMKRAWDLATAKHVKETLELSEKYRAIEARQAKQMQEMVKDAQRQVDKAQVDASNARKSAASLRDTLDAYVGGSAASAAATGDCTATEASARMLADMYRGAIEHATEVGVFADRAYTAGKACEQSYDSLMR